MTEAELRAAAKTFGEIRSLKENLEREQAKLDLINKHVKKGESWKVDLALSKGDSYSRGLSIFVTIPAEIIQQQAVNNVSRIRREIIALGGEID